MKKLIYLLPVLLFGLVACNDAGPEKNHDLVIPPTPAINYSVVNVHPHDTSFYTEGLEFYKGQLFESSGGDMNVSPYPSAVGVLDTKKGLVDVKIELDKTKYFGEGITFFNDKLYLLTYKSRVGFVYDPKTWKKIKEFPLPSAEGWGLTHDSTHLIMSDGSSNLYYLSPDSLRLLNVLRVSDNHGPVPNINELEYVNGHIYANQWLTNYIFKIDPASGKVIGRIDLSGLARSSGGGNNVPDWNGIAYDSTTGNLFVTAKKWPSMYELKF